MELGKIIMPLVYAEAIFFILLQIRLNIKNKSDQD